MKLDYWKKYDGVLKNFTPKEIYQMVLGFAQKLGEPFFKKGKYGRKTKLKSTEYAAYIVYKIITKNATYRDMEFESKM